MTTRSYVATWIAIALLPTLAAAQTGDAGIFRWDGRQWVQHEGSGTRIGVGPDGSPWVVNSRNEIFRWENGSFRRLPGAAKDIGVGAEGSAWIVGTDDRVYKWNGSTWIGVSGGGMAISVDRFGSPWVVNAAGEIYHWEGSRFVRRPGGARDIGAASDVWLVGTDNAIYRLAGTEWSPVGGSGARISAGAPGTAWVVNQGGEIYRWQNGMFERLPGSATDVGVNARGDAWVIGTTAPTQSGNQLLLFRERDFRGRPFAIDGPRRSLPGLFSQARSLQVRGGVWEVCESPGFEGRCITVSSDVADLGSIGLANFVGSVRPRAGPTPR
jgi:Tectonin domain/Beta/Gamma crystallin